MIGAVEYGTVLCLTMHQHLNWTTRSGPSMRFQVAKKVEVTLNYMYARSSEFRTGSESAA